MDGVINKLDQEVKALKRKLEEQKGELDEKKEELDEKKKELDEYVKELDSSKRKIIKQEHLLQQVTDKLECPVCMEIPRSGPVPVCPNGHIVCKNCKTDSCPTCRTAMGVGRSLLAVTILENIEHRCRFDDCAKNFPLDDVEKHEAVCEHRTVSCPHVVCKEIVPLSKLVDHLIKSENCSLQDSLHETLETWNLRNYTLSKETQADINWPLRVYSFAGVVFAVFPNKSEGQFYFIMVMFASGNVCSQYKFEMIAHDYGSEALESEMTVKFQGNPLSIDLKKKELNLFGTSEQFMGKILKKSDNNKSAFSLSFKICKK